MKIKKRRKLRLDAPPNVSPSATEASNGPPNTAPNGAPPFGARAPAAGVLPGLALFLILFFPAIFLGRQFFFRDVGEYYYPMFWQVQKDLNAGRLPLWTPYENLGQPLLGNPTTSVFYPGKLIFFLTGLWPDGFDFCFIFYILVHFPIAFYGLWRLARRWKLSGTASLFAATVYTFSAPVFFQHTNPIFLIGAAWLPWGIEQGDRLLVERRLCPALNLAVILALMTTGGEPQSAYLVGLMTLVLWFLRRRNGSDRDKRESPFDTLAEPSAEPTVEPLAESSAEPIVEPPAESSAEPTVEPLAESSAETPRRYTRTLSPFWLLAGAGILGVLLSSSAIIPALTFGSRSDRRAAVPISVWRIPGFLARRGAFGETPDGSVDLNLYFDTLRTDEKGAARALYDSLSYRKFTYGDLACDAYRFSVHPIQLLEFFWPYWNGDPIEPRRWWNGAVVDYYFWTPAFSFGALGFLLAVSTFSLRRRAPIPIRWASWTALIFLLAAMGVYGPHWFVRLFRSWFVEPQNLAPAAGDPVFGVYWLMNLLLPMFDSFRYPVKLMSAVMLAGSLLAGFGLDRAESVRTCRTAICLIAVTLIGLLIVALFGIENLRPQVFLRSAMPWDMSGVRRILFLSFLEPLAVIALFFLLLRLLRAKRSARSTALAGTLLLTLTAADFLFILAPTVMTVPREELRKPSPFAAVIAADTAEDNTAEDTADAATGLDRLPGVVVPPRLFFGFSQEEPRALLQCPAGKGIKEGLFKWHRAALFPRTNLFDGIAAFPSTGTMMSGDANMLGVNLIGQLYGIYPNKEAMPAMMAFYDIRYATLSSGRVPSGPLWEIAARGPDAQETKPSADVAEFPTEATLMKVLPQGERIRILRGSGRKNFTTYSVFDGQRSDLYEPPRPGEYVRLTGYEPNRIAFETRLTSPGTILLAEQYWPGWRAFVSGTNTPGEAEPLVIRNDLGLRQVELPAGDWSVEMIYRPRDVAFGLFLSLAALLTAAALYTADFFIFRAASKKPCLDPTDEKSF